MNIDEKIRKELEGDAEKLDEILAHEPGIFGMLGNAFKGSLGRWMIIVGVFTFVLTVVMFWSGYQFFFVEDTEIHKMYWAVVLLLSTMVQIALKMWTFMEMNRQSVIRESKRLELAVEKLTVPTTLSAGMTLTLHSEPSARNRKACLGGAKAPQS